MKVPGTSANAEEYLTRLDDAFARLEQGLGIEDARESGTTTTDLGEFEEAFDRIDRQLNGAVEMPTADVGDATIEPSLPIPAEDPAPVQDQPAEPAPAVPSKAVLALVAPMPAAPAFDHASPPLSDDFDEPWRKPGGGGAPLERLVGTIQNLLWLGRAIESRNSKIAQHMRWEQAGEVLSDARALCDEFDLPTARVRADFAIDAFYQDRLDQLAVEIKELVRHLQHDLESTQVVTVPRQRTWILTLALDARAAHAFPSAIVEVEAASRCLTFGMHGAAIFHLLRAAECGRVALSRAIRLYVSAPEARDWTHTVAAIQKRAGAMRRWPAGPSRKAARDYFAAVLSDARSFEDLRRRVDEGEVFEECHAVAAWYATRDFLTLAAEHVSEMNAALLGPDQFIPRT